MAVYEAYVNPGEFNNLFFIEEDEEGRPVMAEAEVEGAATTVDTYHDMGLAETAIGSLELVNEATPIFSKPTISS